jgi:hypothetical protein
MKGREFMTFDQRVAVAKPYITGFVIGLIVAPIVAFSAGWVSTTSARADAVENARVETFAGLCSTKVQSMATSQNIDLATLKGYANRDKRQALVTAAMGDFQTPDALVSKVSNSCERTLG